MEQLSFTAAVTKFFGKKPGQTNGEYLAELKALTPEDRAYFARLFETVGIEIINVTTGGKIA